MSGPVSHCGCGTIHDAESWATLSFVGLMSNGGEQLLELRNCGCGSTLSVVRSIKDYAGLVDLCAQCGDVVRFEGHVQRGGFAVYAHGGIFCSMACADAWSMTCACGCRS